MKKLLVAVLSLIVVSAQAQTADEVIQKYSAAMGGLDAFNNIKTAKLTGTASMQGMDLPLTTQIVNGKALRTDVEVMGQSVTNCYNNGTGWKINPFQGATTATAVSGTELNDLKTQSSMANPLMDYKAKGHTVEMLGAETVDGVKVNKIKLTNKDDGKVTTYYISVADNTLVKSVTTRDMQGQQVEVSTVNSDLKEFGGIKFFMTRSLIMNGEEFQVVRFDKLELNVPVDAKIFEMPK
ncbi:MAG: hypothetical protein ABI685_06255 [Ferruginibacter sp.]